MPSNAAEAYTHVMRIQKVSDPVTLAFFSIVTGSQEYSVSWRRAKLRCKVGSPCRIVQELYQPLEASKTALFCFYHVVELIIKADQYDRGVGTDPGHQKVL
jgi:hypothetical protein